jgi:uncharacterized protein YjdB
MVKFGYFYLMLLLFVSNVLFAQIKINEIQPTNTKTILDPDYGKTGDWIELYNMGANSVTVGGYYLTDDASEPRKWAIPAGTIIVSKGFLLIWADNKATGLHTNFKLSSSGEKLKLFSSTMLLLDTVTFGAFDPDVVYGRKVDGTGAWDKLSIPTPGKANNATVVKGIAPKPTFSVVGGYYSSDQTVTLSSSIPGAVIRYTTDGSEPTSTSTIYSTPIVAKSTNKTTQKYGDSRNNFTGIQKYQWPTSLTYPTNRYMGTRDYGFVIKAKVFHTDYVPSNCATSTYFINLRKPTLPVVSVCTHFNNFFNADSGIYIQGVKGIAAPVSSTQTVTANWNQDWEREVTLEYFDANGAKKFDISAGVQTMGAVSRNFDLKSLVVAMKSKYEDGKINYSLFGASGLSTYDAFLLRSSGNDWEQGNMARDAIIQAVLKNQVDLEVQAYQPVVMYLNGEYWSLINMQERYDAEYFAGYHSYVDPDKIDILKIDGDLNKMIPSDGDSARFEEMMTYLRANSMTVQANYDYVKSHYIDVSNMMNYYIAELYCQNTDWPKNNFRMWRPRTENGKFRFPLYDTDFGYGYWGGAATDNPYTNFNSNSTSIVVEMFKYMMLNPDFKSEFIQRFSYMLNTTYSASRLTNIANNIESAIATERDTYTNAEWTRTTGSGYNTAAMISWGSSRIGNMRTFLNSEYGSKGWQTLTVNYTASQGSVTLSGLTVAPGYSAQQYASTPIRLNAIPADGYQFVGWKNGATTVSTNQEYQLTITAATTISAVFEARPNVNTVKINEILTSNQTVNANSLGKYEDWIELHNSGTASIDIAGLYLSDNSLQPTLYQIPYGFPTQTTIAAGGFLLLWADGAPEEGVLHLPFKLSKDGDTLLLSQKGSTGTIISVDNMIYGKQNTDISYGRYPDDNANKIIFSVPTPNASNVIQSTTFIDGLKITEFMAKNSSTIKEETGSYADYIEIYNSNSTAVDLGGLFVTNDLTNPNMYMIPKGMSSQTTVAAKGYYILWADKQIEINPNHVDFNLNAEAGSIAIVQNRGAQNYIIDQVSYTNQGEDIAYGIYPVGSTTWKYLIKPTPGADNKNDSTVTSISGITINECLALNTKTKADEVGQFDDYIEFYNANTTDVNLGGLFVSDTGTYTLKYRIPRDNAAATTIKAGQWLTFWADNNLSQGSLHLGFDLSSAGEEVSLSQVTQNGIVQLDTLAFGKQTNDVSYGRFPEKSANKELMTPSYNARNTSATDIAILKTITSTIGTLTTSIQSTVFAYKFILPEGTTATPVISATSVNSSATISIVQAQSVNDVATITVTSPSGLYTNVYTISFGIQMANDASLSSLSVANSTLSPAFSSTVYYYTANTTSFLVPLVTAIPTSANAVVSIVYATSLDKNTVVTVTAESGDKKEYVISHLFTPTAISQWTDNFDDNLNQNIVPSLATGGSYSITESGQQLTTHFVRALGAVNNDYYSYKIPQGLVVSANPTLYVNFDATCTENKLEPANTNIALRVEVVDANGNSSDLSSNTVTVTATKTTFNLDFTGALTGSAGAVDKTKIAEVRFFFEYLKNDKNRDKTAVFDNLVIGPLTAAVLSNNASLATLTSTVGTLSPTFAAATTNYTLTLPAGTTTIPTVSATVAQANASIQISQSSKLDGTATIRVVAQDKVTIKTYTVKLVQTPSVVEGYIENIVRPDIPGWSVGNTTYSVAYNAGALDVTYNRTATSGNNSITFNLANEAAKYLNLTNYPYFAIKAKTSTPITLRVDYFDVNGNITNSSPVTVAMTGTSDSIYVFTFTNKFTQTTPTATVDITKIYGVKIYFDAGTTATKTGTVSFDKLMFGSEAVFALNFPPVISAIPNQSIMQGQTFSNILLDSYVTDDNTIDSKLKWTASSTTNVTVTIASNVVTIVPKVTTWLGTETVTFTCTDEAGAASTKTVSFTVTELKIPVTSISFIQSSVSVAKSATVNVKNYLQINPTNATILSTTWSSDNANVTVDANGIVTNNLAFGTETAIITVTVVDKSNNTYTSTISVVATGCPTALSSVMLSQTTATVIEKLTLQLTATLTPSTACVKSYTYTSSNTTVATVSSTGLITALVPGTSVITVSYNDGFSVKSATCSLTVAPTPVTSITLTPSTSTTLTVGSTLTISSVVAPTAAPDKSLSWLSSDINVVSVNGTGVLTAVKVGTALITATSVQNPTVSTTLLVNVIPVAVTSITFNPAAATTMTVGGTQTITAVIAPTNATDKSINWTTSDANLATVSTTGFVTALKAGTVTITATSVQNPGIFQKATIVISDIMPASISISPVGTQSVFVGSSVSLAASILPSNAANQTVTWTSSDATIASVDANGNVLGLKVGTVSITVTSNAVSTLKATSTVIVNLVAVTAISFNPALITTMTVGETQSLTAEITPTNATDKSINWSTSDATLATISTSGVVSALKAGTVSITCSSVQNPSVKQTGIITISDILPSSITLSPNSTQTVNVGASLVITPTILPNNAANQSITWSSSDVTIATVDGTGKINGLKAGTVTITATSNAISTVKSSLIVIVNNVLISSINVTPTALNLIIGQVTQLTASIAPSNATLKTFKWSTSDNSKVTIDASGTITAIALGTVTITATADDAGTVKGTCIVTVKPVMPVSIAAADISLLTSETAGKTITYSFTPDSTTNKAVSFSSLNTSVATVDANGLVKPVGVGSTTITITSIADGTVKKVINVTVTATIYNIVSVTVNPVSVTLSPNKTQTVTTTLNPVNASVNTISWTSDNGSVATVDGNGVITAVALGIANITVTVTTPAASKSATVAVTVQAILVSSITLDQTSLLLTTASAPTTLKATVLPVDATNSSVQWTSNNTDVVTISQAGVVSVVGLGTATIICSAKDASAKSASCLVTVTNVQPTSVTTSASSLALNIGETLTVSASVLPSNAPQGIVWSIANNTIASINTNGTIVALKAGTTTITAASQELPTIYKIITLKVSTVPVTSIVLDQTALMLNLLSPSTKITATVNPINATDNSVTWSVTPAGIVSVTGGVISVQTLGSATVTCSANDGSAVKATCIVNVTNVDPASISIDSASVAMKVGATCTLHSTILPALAPQSVTWTILDNTIATIDANGKIVALKAGSTTITATSTTLTSVNKSIPIVVSIITVTSISLDKTSLTIDLPTNTALLVATISPLNATNGTITWSTSNSTIATVDAIGKISILSDGDVIITATSSNGLSANCTIKVNPVVASSISIDNTSLSLNIGDSKQLTASVLPSNTKDKSVSWISLSPTVASVNSSGNVQGLSEGTAIIKATTSNGIVATCNVTVSAINATSITLSKLNDTLFVYGTDILTATILPINTTNKAITWNTSDSKVATINNGTITAVSAGYATIIASTVNGIIGFCNLVVKDIEPTAITAVVSSTTMNIGTSQTISVVFTPTNVTAKSVSYNSNNPLIASVDNNGVITANSAGDAIITLVTPNGIIRTVAIKVNPIQVNSVSLNVASVTLLVQENQQLLVNVYPTNASDKSVVWSSSDANIASVDNFGKITALKVGSASIRVTAASGIFTECSVKVVAKTILVESVTVTPKTISLNVGQSQSITATVLPVDATNQSLIWTSNLVSVASVDQTGKITANAIGQAKVIVASSNGINDTVTVNVIPIAVQTVSVDLDFLGLGIGESQFVKAQILPSTATNKIVTWTSANTTIATVSSTGRVTGNSAGSVYIYATSVNGLKDSCIVVVSQIIFPAESIVFDVSSLTLKVDDTVKISATVYPLNTSNKAITWIVSDQTKIAIDILGNVTALSVGTATIIATTSNGKSDTLVVTVLPTMAQKVILSMTSDTLDIDESLLLSASFLPAKTTDKTVIWSTSNQNIAIVNQSGLVTAKSAGTVQITATSSNNVASQCEIIVNPMLASSIILSLDSTVLEYSKTLQLSVIIQPANVTDPTIVWASSDPTIAKVDATGKITAVGYGVVKITATTVNGISSSCVVKIDLNNTAPQTQTIPEQKAVRGKAFANLDLSKYVTDDNTSITNLYWSIDASSTISLTIDSKGLAKITPTNSKWVGSETIAVYVTDQQGLVSRIDIKITVESDVFIDEITNNEVSVYPNPTTGKCLLHYSISTALIKSISVYNALGEKIIVELVNGNSFGDKLFDFSKLAKGVYFIVLSDGTSNYQTSLVIE